jgi:hypothetical protein
MRATFVLGALLATALLAPLTSAGEGPGVETCPDGGVGGSVIPPEPFSGGQEGVAMLALEIGTDGELLTACCPADPTAGCAIRAVPGVRLHLDLPILDTIIGLLPPLPPLPPLPIPPLPI